MMRMFHVCVTALLIFKSTLVYGSHGGDTRRCIHGHLEGEHCVCDIGYEGIHCDVVSLHNCLNGGSFKVTSQQCECLQGFTGSKCEIVVNPCDSVPCINGNCSRDLNGFICSCMTGFTGLYCDEMLPDAEKTTISLSLPLTTHLPTSTAGIENPCSSQPCQHGSHCYHDDISFICVCLQNYTGKLCETLHLAALPVVEETAQFMPTTTHLQTTTAAPQYLMPLTFGPDVLTDHHLSTTQPAITVKHCDVLQVFTALAKGTAIYHQQARHCDNNDGSMSDAVVIQHCSAPPASTWIKGLQVISQCETISKHIAIAQFHHGAITKVTGVFIGCQNNGDILQIVSQSCNDGIKLRNITWPESETYFTVNWK